MASSSIFAMQVIRCPACHARLPVDGRAAIVRCEYCDARVEIERRAGPAPNPMPRRHVAQPQYSGFAWSLVLVPVVFLISTGITAYQWFFARDAATVTATAPVAAPAPIAAPQVPTIHEVDLPDPPPPATVPPDEPEPPAKAPTEVPQPTRPRVPNDTKPATPTGPVISVDEARKQLEPMARACLQKAGAHHLLAYMGNTKLGPVKLLPDSRTRVDGVKVALAKTALGRCLDEAGAKVRTSALKSDYVRLDVRNAGVADPLAGLPANADQKAVRGVIAAFDDDVKACARKHGVEGSRESFRFTIDGPSGKVASVTGTWLAKPFRACAEAIYAKARFEKVRASSYQVTYPLQL